MEISQNFVAFSEYMNFKYQIQSELTIQGEFAELSTRLAHL